MDWSAIDPAIFAEAIRVNAETPTAMAQAFLNKARARGGKRVIQFLDQKIANPNPDFFSYTMAKHALASTVKMLAMAQGRPEGFRFHHISTDEVFGSLGPTGRFSETTPYDPRSERPRESVWARLRAQGPTERPSPQPQACRRPPG